MLAFSFITFWEMNRTTPEILDEDFRLAVLMAACALFSLLRSLNHFLDVRTLLSKTLATLNSLSPGLVLEGTDMKKVFLVALEGLS